MMLQFQLALLRHADAQSPDGSISDFDRPLSLKGQEQADSIAVHIREDAIHFAKVFCSPAIRTKQTFERLRLPTDTPVIYLKGLYDGGVSDYLDAIKGENCHPVLIIGHNPTIHSLLIRLCKSTYLTTPLPFTYQTACLSLLSFHEGSHISESRKADLISYIQP